MPGTMSDQQLTDLANATGPAFDRMFLQLMTAQHRGAITMSKTELSAGTSTAARALATRIVAAQTAEIAAMQRLLTSG